LVIVASTRFSSSNLATPKSRKLDGAVGGDQDIAGFGNMYDQTLVRVLHGETDCAKQIQSGWYRQLAGITSSRRSIRRRHTHGEPCVPGGGRLPSISCAMLGCCNAARICRSERCSSTPLSAPRQSA
jgi:hypothetical protein